MGSLFIIHCSFQTKKQGKVHKGLAVCSDADTPITFVYKNGTPHTGEIWNYALYHHIPWAEFQEIGDGS